jgi:hypothetical protein
LAIQIHEGKKKVPEKENFADFFAEFFILLRSAKKPLRSKYNFCAIQIFALLGMKNFLKWAL